jgi:hypothetical protein
MQLSNVMLRLGGSLQHVVPKTQVTPAEIMVLQRIHGADAVVNVRPVKFDRNRRHADEYDRLAQFYDGAASDNVPGEEAKSILKDLFPGAMKKLPETLEEIGFGHAHSAAAQAAAQAEEEAIRQAEEPVQIFLHEDDLSDDGSAAEAEDASDLFDGKAKK